MASRPFETKPVDQTAPVDYVVGIDGLRAIAVLSVLLYHFNGSLLPGGFIGVDVFFVISGYVISNSLAKHRSPGLSAFLLDFYKRRLLRIMPALLACLLVTVLASSLFIPESWLSAKNDITGAHAFFGLSNFALLSDMDGYFSERIEFNPYVHTWSLAVEEQFYLVLPAMLFFVVGKAGQATSRFLAFSLFAALGLGSLAYSAYETSHSQQHAFYLLPSRFWEMASGAVLCWLHARGVGARQMGLSRQTNELLGASLLVLGFVWANERSFPFPWAIAPVLGTALLIDSLVRIEGARSIGNRLLERREVVYVGKISYSLYLWHWPTLVMFRWTVGLEGAFPLVALFLTTVLSVLSYHALELPGRRSAWLRTMKSKTVVLAFVAATCVAFALGNTVSSRPWVFNQSVTFHDNDWKAYYIDPRLKGLNSPGIDPPKRALFVVGDSHASSYSALLGYASLHLGLRVHTLALPGCPFASLVKPYPETRACRAFVEETMRFLKAQSREGDIVFLASLRTYRLGSPTRGFRDAEVLEARDSALGRADRLAAFHQSDQIVASLHRMGLRVLIDAPKPVFRAPPFRCADWFNRMNPICAPGFTISRSFLKQHNQPIMEGLTELKERHPSIEIWDPFPSLCGTDVCSAYSGGRPLFFDGDHLSGYGNSILVPEFESKLLNLLGLSESLTPAIN